MIGTEANSSATLGLALFSGCDILKSSMVRHSSPLLLLRVPRPDLLGRDGACQYSGLYIHAHKSFAINQCLYIQNRKPCVISKSMGIPGRGYSAPHTRTLTVSPFVYTCLEVLCHQPIFVYTEPQPICYQRIVAMRIGDGVHGARPLETRQQTRPGRISQTSRNPLQTAPARLAVSSVPARRKNKWH